MKFFCLIFGLFFSFWPLALSAEMEGGDYTIYADTFSTFQDQLSTGGTFSAYSSGGETPGRMGRAATGSITNTAVAGAVANSEFTLSDGNVTTTFTFRIIDGSTSGNIMGGTVTVDVGGGATVAQIADRIAVAINHANANLEIDATSNGVSAISLVNTRTFDTEGNVPMTETVADAGFVVSGMSGGGTSGFVLSGGFQAMERASLSLSVNPSSLSLGELSLTQVKSGSATMRISTDSATGYAVSISEDGNLRTAGGLDIDDVSDGTVSVGSEEYGVSTSGGGGLLSSDTAITGSVSLAESNGEVTDEETTVTFEASVGGSSRAGTYSHIVTFTMIANP